MAIIKRTQLVNAPVEDVFQTIADGGSFASWNPTIRAGRTPVPLQPARRADPHRSRTRDAAKGRLRAVRADDGHDRPQEPPRHGERDPAARGAMSALRGQAAYGARLAGSEPARPPRLGIEHRGRLWASLTESNPSYPGGDHDGEADPGRVPAGHALPDRRRRRGGDRFLQVSARSHRADAEERTGRSRRARRARARRRGDHARRRNPRHGGPKPDDDRWHPVSLHVYVEDSDATFRRAIDAGAKSLRAIEDQFYGDRSGQFEDPFGHKWNVATHVEDVPPEEMRERAQAAMASA
jgi:Glyoxalase-like domain